MALVYNYNKDIAVATFVSGLQVTNPFYKYLVKNDVTKIREILVRVQNYIQIEEATRSASSRPLRQGPEVEKPKPQLSMKRNLSHNLAAIHKRARRVAEFSKGGETEPDLIPFRVIIDHIFNAMKD